MNQGISNPGQDNPEDMFQPEAEVDSSDLQTLERKIAELMKHPRPTTEGLPEAGTDEADIAQNQGGDWNTSYLKRGVFVRLRMPQPGIISQTETSALVITPVQVDSEGNTNYKEERYTSHQAATGGYSSADLVTDRTGKRIPGPRISPNDIFDMVQLEKSLGENIFTKKRLSKLMGVLDSLQPEDEIIT